MIHNHSRRLFAASLLFNFGFPFLFFANWFIFIAYTTMTQVFFSIIFDRKSRDQISIIIERVWIIWNCRGECTKERWGQSIYKLLLAIWMTTKIKQKLRDIGRICVRLWYVLEGTCIDCFSILRKINADFLCVPCDLWMWIPFYLLISFIMLKL